MAGGRQLARRARACLSTSTRTSTRTSPNSTYDLAVVGAGSGGLATARRAAEHGARVALVEVDRLGGTCVNVGCVPKKVMWEAANLVEGAKAHAPVYELMANGADSGSSSESVNYPALKTKRDAYIERLNGIYGSAIDASNAAGTGGSIDLFRDGASLAVGADGAVSGLVLGSSGAEVPASAVVIASGSTPVLPAGLPGAADYGSTSDDFFGWASLPESVAVVGGGYIGAELAGIMATLGSKTSLIVRGPQVLGGLDPEIAQVLQERLVHSGVDLVLSADLCAVTKGPAGLTLETESGTAGLGSFDKVLFATGRRPLTDGLGLESAGVAVDASGAIVVDEHHVSSVPNVYAVGDVAATPGNLTPVAIKAGRTLAERLFNPAAASAPALDYTNIPTVMFTHPPIGSVGVSEAEAAALYGPGNIKVYSARFTNLAFGLHAPEDKEPTLFRIIVNTADSERVVGLHGIGRGVDEALQGFAVALKMGATKADLDATFAIHPTAAEEFVTMR